MHMAGAQPAQSCRDETDNAQGVHGQGGHAPFSSLAQRRGANSFREITMALSLTPGFKTYHEVRLRDTYLITNSYPILDGTIMKR